jgi:cytochrome c
MTDRFNTIAGWVLGGGIVLLGATLVTGEYFKAERPETMGYPIAGVQEEGAGGAEAEQPIAHFLQTADAGRGERVFAKCAACHTINAGGASGVGPNLHATMGAPLAHVAGFAYSEALRGKGGNWTWEAMSEWLRSPRAFAPGTKMTFAGLSDPQDRADLMVYMNAQGSALPLPAAPAAGPAAPGPAGEAPGNAANASPAVNGAAPDQPVVNEAQAARAPGSRVGGEAAPGAGTNSTDR